MNWYGMRAHEVEERTNTNVKVGLTEKEAEGRIKKFGTNELDEAKRPSALMVFLAQFKDFMVLVLFGATIVSAFLGNTLILLRLWQLLLSMVFSDFFKKERLKSHWKL